MWVRSDDGKRLDSSPSQLESLILVKTRICWKKKGKAGTISWRAIEAPKWKMIAKKKNWILDRGRREIEQNTHETKTG